MLIAAGAISSNVFAQAASGTAPNTVDASNETRAATLYDRGVDAHDRGFFADAAMFFADADALAPNDVTLETALRECVRADAAVLGMRLHARAARVVAPSSGLLSALRDVQLKFSDRVGYVQLACKACQATLGGVPLSTSVELPVEPGAHSILFDPDTTGSLELTIKAGEHATVSPRAPSPPPVTPVAASDGIHPGWLTIGIVTTLGLGAASIGSYVQASALADELAILRAAHIVEGAADVSAAGQNAETRMIAFAALTGVSVVVTAALAIWAVDWDGSESVAISIGPGGLLARGQF